MHRGGHGVVRLDGESRGWREGVDWKRLGRRGLTRSSPHRAVIRGLGMCDGQ